MITAARLRDYNPRQGNKMRSYTSARGNKYMAGTGIVPGAWRVVRNTDEIAELSEIPQFQIRQFETMEDLEAQVQEDMEDGVRVGKPPVRAAINRDERTAEMSRTTDESKIASVKKEAVERAVALLTPVPVDDEEVEEKATAPKPVAAVTATVETVEDAPVKKRAPARRKKK